MLCIYLACVWPFTSPLSSYFLHAHGGEVLLADPASAAKNKGTDQKLENRIQFLPTRGAGSMGETNICSGNQTNSPEAETSGKKREESGGDEEAEEGEIVDSSDKEDEGITEEDGGTEEGAAHA